MLCLPSGQIRRSRPGVWIGAGAISSVTEPQQLAIAYTPFVSTSPRGDASCTSRSGALATHLRRATTTGVGVASKLARHGRKWAPAAACARVDHLRFAVIHGASRDQDLLAPHHRPRN